MSETAQTITLAKEKAERVRDEVIHRFGLNRGDIVEGSLILNWDSDSALIEWRGCIVLSPDEMADIFATALAPAPAGDSGGERGE